MNILLLHDAVPPDAAPDELDVYSQLETVERALDELGHTHSRLPFSFDVASIMARLRELKPDLVFNLVESVEGQGRYIHFAPFLLEAMRIPYTGCPALAVYCTSNKLAAKEMMARAHIPTPTPMDLDFLRRYGGFGEDRVIVKSVWEHASRGLDEHSVVSGTDAVPALESLERKLDGGAFAELYIEGREFNVSLLAGDPSPGHVSEWFPLGRSESLERRLATKLPVAEIVFEDYPRGKPKVVGYSAKWDESSFEYQHTPRRFDFPASDIPLLNELRRLASWAWGLFNCRGYARVDFRVDDRGRPWVLEVNTNPCLSPDAGFAAALARGGLSITQAVERIIAASTDPASLLRKGVSVPSPTQGSRLGRCGERQVLFRDEPRPSDSAAIREIVAATGFFHEFETDVAVELIDERLARGLASEYFFLFADDPDTDTLLGYACFGPIACTVGSYDLYWIAVHNDHRGKGLGQTLMAELERRIAEGLPNPANPSETVRGRRIYIETSSKPQYAPTQSFYTRCGYHAEARFADFYAPGDDKLVYSKAL